MERTTCAEALAVGAAEYRDVLEALVEAGFDAEFTQTGGMCAAIEISLGSGRCLLLTDRDDPLSWKRDDHDGWRVGLYEEEPGLPNDGPGTSARSRRGSAATAVDLVRRITNSRRPECRHRRRSLGAIRRADLLAARAHGSAR